MFLVRLGPLGHNVAATVSAESVLAKRLSRAIWSSFNKEGMSHFCDSTVAGPATKRDNAMASQWEYPPFPLPPLFKPAPIYICVYMYICCRVKNWSKIWGF